MTSVDQNPAKAHPLRDWLLVVDDDEPICVLIKDALSSDALEVVTTNDGHTALQALDHRDTEPLVAVVDVLMPGMDGLTLARKLCARLKRSKIIVISGHLSNDSWWPVDLREITFLTKPFRLAELSELIDAARAEFRGEI